MADTFKGIITADGKKRTFAREGITPEYVSDKTLSVDGGFADAKVTGDAVKSLKEDLISKADKTSLVKTDRKLDALWKLNQGISYEFQTDDAEAYQKTVPSGAKMANVKRIGGKTIVWNQLVEHIESHIENNVSINVDEKGTFVLNGTSNATIYLKLNNEKKSIIGHKYYISQKRYPVNSDAYIYNDGGGITLDSAKSAIQTATLEKNFYLRCDSDTTFDNVVLKPIIFDLTQMFGSGNEPSTPEEFETMFPADYYPYNAGELMSASVNEVIYLDTKNQETSYPIPQAILNLDGYGDGVTDNVYNYVDWENKKYHKRVGKVDLGTVNDFILGKPLNDGSGNVFYFTGKESGFKKNGKAISNKLIYSIPLSGQWEDLKLNETYIDSGCYVVVAHNVSTLDEFKQAMSGVILYYELAEEQITDISDLIGDTLQEPIEVEAGGSLTFQNTHGANYRVPVPNTVEYTVKLSEVAK